MSDNQDPLKLLRERFPNTKPVPKAPMTTFGLLRSLFFVAAFAAVVGGIWWGVHTSNPQYKAKQQLNEAKQLAADGKPLVAAGLFLEVMNRGYFIEESKVGYRQAVEPFIQHAELDERLRVYSLLGNQIGGVKPQLPDLVAAAVAAAFKDVNDLAEDQPDRGLEVAERLKILDPGHKGLPALGLKLLERVVATQPENTPRAVELALIYEKDEQLEEAGKLLAPHRRKLGVTEGARLLGQINLSDGDYEGAFQLLGPYVKSKMDLLHRTEKSYTNTLNNISQAAIKRLEDGLASKSWYDRYNAASETEKGNMVDEYVGQFMKNDARYKRAVANMETANEFVNVALDLGVAQLNRAQGIADPKARKSALNDARKTFLSIQSFAGQSNEYLLFMGQVNYWLGNAAEGREQFEQLMEQTKKAFNIMLAVANSVREVGDINWARELVEEAYTGTIKKEEMYAAARQRALMNKDTDDQIKWLELSDPEAADTIISLNTARGRKAMEDDMKAEAAKFFREAVRGYEKLPRNASTLNNKALAYQDLYSVSGSVAEFMHCVELMNEATKLSPEDAILTINSATIAFTAAYFEMLTNHLDFSVLKSRPDISMVSLLFENETGRKGVHARLRESKTFKKAVTQLDRSMVLSPKRANSYLLSLEVNRALRDLTALKKLSQQVASAEPDVELLKESYLAAYAPDADPDQTIESLRMSLAETTRNLMKLKDRSSPTAVMLRLQRLSIQSSLIREGAQSDLTALTKSARKLVQDVNNRSTRGLLLEVLSLQALQELLAQHPSLVPVEKQTRNLFSSANFLIHVLEQGGAPAQFLTDNAAAKEAAGLYREIQDQFPDRPSPKSWAFIRHFDPAYAQKMVARMKADEVSRLADQLRYSLVPYNASTVLTQYHRTLAGGDVAGATALYNAAIKRGVPLPAL